MQPKRITPSRCRGLRVVGPGFYLWDLDPREALCLAAELRRRPVPLPRLRRAPPSSGVQVTSGCPSSPVGW